MTTQAQQRSLTSPDAGNPWLCFHRLPSQRLNGTKIASPSAMEDQDDGYAVDATQRECIEKQSDDIVYNCHDDNESANVSDRRRIADNNNNLGGVIERVFTSKCQAAEPNIADADPYSEFVGKDNKSEIIKFMKGRNDDKKRRAKKTAIACKTDSCSEIEFALECKIEDCDCENNWECHKETLYESMAVQSCTSASDDDDVLEQAKDNLCMYSNSKDLGSRIRSLVAPAMHAWDHVQQNEWSPFMSSHLSDNKTIEPEDVGDNLDVSSLSLSDDDDDDEDVGGDMEQDVARMDASAEFELVEWSTEQDAEYQTKVVKTGLNRRHDSCSTQTKSPSLDLSGLDGYQTAPNSPTSTTDDEYCIVDGHANATNHAVVYQPSDINANQTHQEPTGVIPTTAGYAYGFSDASAADTVMEDVQHTDTDSSDKCAKCHRHLPGQVTQHAQIQDSHMNRLENAIANAHSKAVTEVSKITHQELYARRPENENRGLALPTPPYISANDIQYEGDPATGDVLVVGRGSFGIVYKARYAYPRPGGHVPQIVVKEFDEEFSDTKEILDEARRLYYLQDTGYVPVCHGILCYRDNAGQTKYGIVQELVGTGLTLEQMLWDNHELPLAYWFRIAYQCCEGLARFHVKGILLNDIKTNNILLEFGEHTMMRIRYIDFGLATDMRGKRYKNTKSLEDFVYLAPEVRLRGGITNIASDIFSLGFMLEQIKKYSGVIELEHVARRCMRDDPGLRIGVRMALSLIKEQMSILRLI